MSVTTRSPFEKGQRKLSAAHLNDIQETAREARKGVKVSVDGGAVRRGANTGGNQIAIEVLPVLYKVTEVIDETTVKGKQADSQSGDTYGPELEFWVLA